MENLLQSLENLPHKRKRTLLTGKVTKVKMRKSAPVCVDIGTPVNIQYVSTFTTHTAAVALGSCLATRRNHVAMLPL